MRECEEASTALPLSLPSAAPSPALKARVLAAATGQAAPRPAIATRLFWAAAAVVLFSVLIGTLTQPTYETYGMAGADPIPGARGTVRWNERSLRFQADGLALLPPGKVYELWHISGGKPAAAGTYSPDPYGSIRGEITLQSPVARGDAFAVTIERAPGEKSPKGPMILTPPRPR